MASVPNHHHPPIPSTSPHHISTTSETEPPRHDCHHSLSHAYQTYLSHDQEEQNHWEDVCRSYRQYATFAMAQWANHQYRLHGMPDSQRRFLPPGLRRETPEFQQRAKMYKDAAVRNQFCLDCILRHAGQPNSQDRPHDGCSTNSKNSSDRHSTDSQMSKVCSTLKALARDWSEEGKQERDAAYGPLLAQIQAHLPVRRPDRPEEMMPVPRLCIPGAGVGRLAWELAALGYAVQGNEFSLYMLLASDFMLNGGIATPEHPIQISPFLLESRNVHAHTDPARPVAIPDVDPFRIMSNPMMSDFSMAAGEFVSIYGNEREKEKWDAMVACFFLDTAPSVVEYIQVMHHCLKPGGYVFNFGPLLWHWSGPAMRPDDKCLETYQNRYSYLDKKYMSSVDLAWSDVRIIFMNVGFDILEEQVGVPALYTSDNRSMMNMTYRCVQFVARKRTSTPSSAPTHNMTSVKPEHASSAPQVAPSRPPETLHVNQEQLLPPEVGHEQAPEQPDNVESTDNLML